MSIKVKKPEVKMNLYETDKDVLKSFITNEKIDGVFTEKYLILQNFADDCRFSSDIQPELMEYYVEQTGWKWEIKQYSVTFLCLTQQLHLIEIIL